MNQLVWTFAHLPRPMPGHFVWILTKVAHNHRSWFQSLKICEVNHGIRLALRLMTLGQRLRSTHLIVRSHLPLPSLLCIISFRSNFTDAQKASSLSSTHHVFGIRQHRIQECNLCTCLHCLPFGPFVCNGPWVFGVSSFKKLPLPSRRADMFRCRLPSRRVLPPLSQPQRWHLW